MEQQIITVYKEKLKNMPNPLKGFNHFDSKAKKQVIICLATLIISSIISFVLSVKFPNKIYYFWFILIAASMDLLVIRIDDLNMERNKKEFHNLENQRIDCLYDTLNTLVGKVNTEKVDIIISIYQNQVDKHDKYVQKRTATGISIISIITGVNVTALFSLINSETAFNVWISFFILSILPALGFLCFILLYNFFQRKKNDYEMIINDLLHLKIIKYDC